MLVAIVILSCLPRGYMPLEACDLVFDFGYRKRLSLETRGIISLAILARGSEGNGRGNLLGCGVKKGGIALYSYPGNGNMEQE